MTEADWFTCTTRPAAMFRHIRAKASRRKLQLLSCACCRLVWDHIPDERLRGAVAAAERYADGEITEDELTSARHAALPITYGGYFSTLRILQASASHYTPGPGDTVAEASIHVDLRAGLESALGWVQEVFAAGDRAIHSRRRHSGWMRSRRTLCDLFREIVGNPFRPWAVPPGYPGGGLVQPDGRRVPVTAAVHALAAGIQADQAFDRLPVLADAAEEAGVTDADLLTHLRHGTGHVRGCWALGVLLGKA